MQCQSCLYQLFVFKHVTLKTLLRILEAFYTWLFFLSHKLYASHSLNWIGQCWALWRRHDRKISPRSVILLPVHRAPLWEECLNWLFTRLAPAPGWGIRSQAWEVERWKLGDGSPRVWFYRRLSFGIDRDNMPFSLTSAALSSEYSWFMSTAPDSNIELRADCPCGENLHVWNVFLNWYEMSSQFPNKTEK